MKSVNKVTLIGAVGKDPEVRYTQAGMAIANFSLATSKKNKEKSDVTQWHNIVAFQKTAELIQQYVKKGSKLYIEGEIQYQEYDKDGEKRYTTKIVANDLSFLSDSGNHSANRDKQKGVDNSKTPALVDALEDDSIPF